MSKSKLTVVVPTFNRPDLLPRALDRLLRQTIPVRIVIADDGDDDVTRKILQEKYGQEWWGENRIFHLCTGADNAWDNWRMGAEHAAIYDEAELIAWHQDDDVVRDTWAARIVQAFDRFPEAHLWMARLQVAPNDKLALWCSGNGPWVPMDMMGGTYCSYAESSVLTSSSYFTSWSLAPAMAFRNTPQFRQALEAMPPKCDIFVERLIPAMACKGHPFIADPVIAGYWVIHDDQLSTKQHKDQPAQTKLLVKHLDQMMDDAPDAWQESLLAWAQLIPTPTVCSWITQIDTTINEGGPSRYARKVQETLVMSLLGRVKFGYGQRWWHRASRWLKDKVAL